MDKNNLAFIEKRAATRYPVALLVEFENGIGWTRDVSANGACIETKLPLGCGAAVRFFLNQLDRESNDTRVQCNGVVVRTNKVGENWQVALEMEAIRFEGYEAVKA